MTCVICKNGEVTGGDHDCDPRARAHHPGRQGRPGTRLPDVRRGVRGRHHHEGTPRDSRDGRAYRRPGRSTAVRRSLTRATEPNHRHPRHPPPLALRFASYGEVSPKRPSAAKADSTHFISTAHLLTRIGGGDGCPFPTPTNIAERGGGKRKSLSTAAPERMDRIATYQAVRPKSKRPGFPSLLLR